MEALLHYCWKHKLLPLGSLETTEGQKVEVIDPGLHNMHAGPDFSGAHIDLFVRPNVPATGMSMAMTMMPPTTMWCCMCVVISTRW